jgi:RNA polymerase sigma-70 factor (ECF subfamily)
MRGEIAPGVDRLAQRGPMSVSDSIRFRMAVHQNYPGLWRFVRRMGLPRHGADDVAQTAFLIALEGLQRIVVGSERAFLYATAVRIVYGIRRRARRELVGADFDLDASPYPPPDELAHQKRMREMLDALLESIERDSRAVLVRFEVDGFTIAEISSALEISRTAANCRLRRARKQFRALVRDHASHA